MLWITGYSCQTLFNYPDLVHTSRSTYLGKHKQNKHEYESKKVNEFRLQQVLDFSELLTQG